MTVDSGTFAGRGSSAEVSRIGVRLEQVYRGRVRSQVPLTDLTTFRTGGRADWLLETQCPKDVVTAVRLSRELALPLTILGGGSNVLVGDGGARGLVLRLRHGAIIQSAINRVQVDAGVTMNGLVRWTIQRGLAGLERWAGTPGTVGGAIRGNAHFEGRLLGDTVTAVELVDRTGAITRVAASAMRFGYDESRVQHTGELVLRAEFEVSSGAAGGLRQAARQSLRYRKQTQPLDRASAGCVFQNPRPDDGTLPADVPYSAGALIERAGLKGLRVGHAVVSSVHGNFIVNEGGAPARDVRALIEQCRKVVTEEFGIVLREELVYFGEFDEV